MKSPVLQHTLTRKKQKNNTNAASNPVKPALMKQEFAIQHCLATLSCGCLVGAMGLPEFTGWAILIHVVTVDLYTVCT